MRLLWVSAALTIWALVQSGDGGQITGQGKGQKKVPGGQEQSGGDEDFLDIVGINGETEGQINGNGNQAGQGLVDYDRCQISGDPHASNFRQERGSLPLPCTFHMAKLLVKTDAGSFIRVDVFASSGTPYGGQYFVDFVQVVVVLLNGKGVGNLTPGESATFTITSARVNDVEQDASTIWETSSADNLGGAVLTDYSPDLHLAKLSLKEASLIVVFRPVNRSERIQSRRPGVAVLVSQDRFPTDGDRFPETICSNGNDNRRYKVLMKEDPYNAENPTQMLLYALLDQAEQQRDERCVVAVDAFRTCTSTRRSQAIRECSKYTSSTFVHCMQLHTDRYALAVFSECIKAFCEDDHQALNSMKSIVNETMGQC